MKAVMMVLALVSLTSAAQADGFKCRTSDGSLSIQVYNHTQASEGTRNAAIMVLSDPAVQYGRKTIAVFRASNSLLGQTGSQYVANVDLRYNDSGRGGELVGGTKLGYLKHIVLGLNFSYGNALEEGAKVRGTVSFLKRNGGDSFLEVLCVRYLKAE